ncbi:hypothetical protein ADL00_42980 [Streptomyces sp. AS58]|nr:hypothetical protein ADL00_42980 [Streptomyces sp. AS58]
MNSNSFMQNSRFSCSVSGCRIIACTLTIFIAILSYATRSRRDTFGSWLLFSVSLNACMVLVCVARSSGVVLGLLMVAKLFIVVGRATDFKSLGSFDT